MPLRPRGLYGAWQRMGDLDLMTDETKEVDPRAFGRES